MDYNFHSGILLGDAHSKHILIILLIDWWNFRKLQEWFSEFEWGKDRPEKEQKTQQSTDRNMEFQYDEHFEASEFCIKGWEYYKWINAALGVLHMK